MSQPTADDLLGVAKFGPRDSHSAISSRNPRGIVGRVGVFGESCCESMAFRGLKAGTFMVGDVTVDAVLRFKPASHLICRRGGTSVGSDACFPSIVISSVDDAKNFPEVS